VTCLFDVIIRPHRSSTYVDVAYCYRPSSVVCRSVTVVIPVKMAEPIEMLFGLWARVGPRNHVLDGGPDPPWERAIFRGIGGPLLSIGTFRSQLCKKTAEPIKIPIGMLSHVDPENHVLDRGADAAMGRGTFRPVYCPLQSIGFWGLAKRVSCAKMVGPILTIYMSYDLFLCKEVLLGIAIRLLPIYGVSLSKHLFLGCE